MKNPLLSEKKLLIKISLLLILITNLLHAQQLNKIYIVDLSVNVSRKVSCENFESSFTDLVNEISLKERERKKLLKILNSLVILHKKPYTDIRFKGTVQSKTRKLVFCGDEGSININGTFYKSSASLVKYLNFIQEKNKAKKVIFKIPHKINDAPSPVYSNFISQHFQKK